MKTMKKVMAFILVAVVAVGLVGCGEISYDDITGDWTTSMINGTSLDEYAQSLGSTPAACASNFKITDDDKIAVTSATQTANYVYERKSNGIEVKEDGKDDILFSMTYDKDAKTLTYEVDLGTGSNMKIVLTKGTTDVSAAAATGTAQ